MSAARALSGFLCLAGWVAALGCVDERPPSGIRPPACLNAVCTGGGIGLGSGGSDGGTSTGGGSQGVLVTGSLVVMSDETFGTFVKYGGEATIHAPAAGGGTVTAPYGGQAGTSFTLAGVQTGFSWLLARDEELGGTGVLSTYTPVILPSASPLSLRMIDSSILSAIAMTVGTFVDPTAAQVVLRVRRKNAALAGVAVTSVGNGLLVFDDGPGIYSVATSATGTAGVIIVLNASPEGANSTISLTLDDGATTFALDPMPALAGGATLADLSL